MTFIEQLNLDMTDNHFRLSEFGELITYKSSSGSAVQFPAIYDEPALSENLGAEVEAISHQPRIFCRRSDLPGGSPSRGDRVEVSANLFHPAKTLEVVSTANEKLGHVELILQAN
jgi:hypothetical protein